MTADQQSAWAADSRLGSVSASIQNLLRPHRYTSYDQEMSTLRASYLAVWPILDDLSFSIQQKFHNK